MAGANPEIEEVGGGYTWWRVYSTQLVVYAVHATLGGSGGMVPHYMRVILRHQRPP